MMFKANEPPYQFRGRFRIAEGKWSVWSRKDGGVSVSKCQPPAINGPAWDRVGCIEFDDEPAYDLFKRPGSEKGILIEPRLDPCDECTVNSGACGDEDGQTYVGRFRIAKGKWSVWCRADGAISVSACQPVAVGQGPTEWALACCHDFDDEDYDFYSKATGTSRTVRIVVVDDGACDECTPDSTSTRD
jgi:hypothetical protein